MNNLFKELLTIMYVFYSSRTSNNTKINQAYVCCKCIINLNSLILEIGFLMLEQVKIMLGLISHLNSLKINNLQIRSFPMIFLTLERIDKIIFLSEVISLINLYKLKLLFNFKITILIQF